MNVELIGYLASALVLISFTRNNLNQIRVISSIAGILWATYGFMIGSPSIIIMNVVLIGIHIYKTFKTKKDEH
jgi:uncharacterized membrane protein